jgi:peroxiredoxin
MKFNILSPFLCILVLLLSSFSAYAIEPGTTAPDFTLPNLEGKTVHLSDFKGKTIVLKLATTWCPSCQQQTQEIQDAGKFLADNHVEVVEVFLMDTSGMVEDYMKGKTFVMPHVELIDDGQVSRAYNVFTIPRMILIDKNFKVCEDGSLMPAGRLEKDLGEIIAGGGCKGLKKK